MFIARFLDLFQSPLCLYIVGTQYSYTLGTFSSKNKQKTKNK